MKPDQLMRHCLSMVYYSNYSFSSLQLNWMGESQLFICGHVLFLCATRWQCLLIKGGHFLRRQCVTQGGNEQLVLGLQTKVHFPSPYMSSGCACVVPLFFFFFKLRQQKQEAKVTHGLKIVLWRLVYGITENPHVSSYWCKINMIHRGCRLALSVLWLSSHTAINRLLMMYPNEMKWWPMYHREGNQQSAPLCPWNAHLMCTRVVWVGLAR